MFAIGKKGCCFQRSREKEGCGQREGTASTPPGYGKTERGSLPVSLSTAR